MSETKTCPFCAETIKAEAVVCRYCGRDLVEKPPPVQEKKKRIGWGRILLVIIVGIILVIWALSRVGSSPSTRTDRPVIVPTSTPSTAKVTVLSVRQGVSTFGRTEATIRVRNDSNATAGGVRIWADCYQGGVNVATEWLPAEPYDLAPGMESARSIRFAEGVKCDRIEARVTVR